MKPLVSVVIPAYNSEQWIRETINSILNQTYQNIEILIIDDRSVDKTYEIVQSIIDVNPDKKILYIKNIYRLGECLTSRRGFELSDGDYLLRVNHDDALVDFGAIEHQVHVMQRTNVDWSYYSQNVMGPDLQNTKVTYANLLPLPIRYSNYPIFQIFDNFLLIFPYFVLLKILVANPIHCNTCMFKRTSYLKSIGWSNIVNTDCDALLFYNLFLNRFKCISINDRIGSFLRIHPGQMSHNMDYVAIRDQNRLDIIQQIINGNFPLWMKVSVMLIKKFKLYKKMINNIHYFPR